MPFRRISADIREIPVKSNENPSFAANPIRDGLILGPGKRFVPNVSISKLAARNVDAASPVRFS